MSQSTVTSVVSFGATAAASANAIGAEIDGYMHLDTDGQERTSFLPGEKVYFIIPVAALENIKIISMRPTDGGDIHKMGRTVTRTRTEQLTFNHPAHLIDLHYLPKDDPDAEWYGRSSNLYRTGKQLQADLAPCLGDITYEVEFYQYRHDPVTDEIPDGEEYPTDIIIEYQEVKA